MVMVILSFAERNGIATSMKDIDIFLFQVIFPRKNIKNLCVLFFDDAPLQENIFVTLLYALKPNF